MLKAVSTRVRAGRNDPISRDFQAIADSHDAVMRGGERWDGKSHTFHEFLYYAPSEQIDGLIAELRRRRDVVQADPVDAPADPHALCERRSGIDRRAKPRARAGERRDV